MTAVLFTAAVIVLCIAVRRAAHGCLDRGSLVFISAVNTDSIEYLVRRAVFAHPRSDIYIMNRSPNPEMSKILALLKRDFPNLYIITPQAPKIAQR